MVQNLSQEESIFQAALALEAADERSAYLDAACAQEPDLRRRVEALLRRCAESQGPLDRGAPMLAPTSAEAIAEQPGMVIGPYKLMEQIGEGGMGLVFVAEQQHPVRRKVALKVIKPGMDTRQVIARFEAERQALALMDHANIAKVLDGGETASGRPYFVMELVKGVPVTNYCDQHQLPVLERLALFLDVCQAAQHAHLKGIIHRDIKPSNVLVASHDGKPVVKVIDFGVAKAIGQQLTDKTVYTHFAQMIGTPLYMSPEQAGLSSLDVDTRSDIYSLGVLLYELLTGTTPFDKERLSQVGYDEMRRIIREEEPPKPSTRISTQGQAASTVSANRKSGPKRLSQLFHGDLDWIVMKALEKDRNRRYETASAFAADVQRYLHDEPVLACPPSAWYRVKKFARRQKSALMIAGLALFFIVLLVGGVGWIVGDRSARQKQAATDIDVALHQTYELQGQLRSLEALEVAKHTQMLLANSGGDEALQQRVHQRVADLALVVKLEEAHLLRTAGADDRFAFERTAAAYAQAFQEYGMELEAVNPEEAGALLRTRDIGVEVAAALDDWNFSTQPTDANIRHQLLAIASAADPDPLRDRVRAMAARRDREDRKTLEDLTAPDQITGLPAPTLVLMARVAHSFMAPSDKGVGDPKWAKRVVDLLRNAHRQHPDDFWINHDLAYALHVLKPPQLDEAVRFFTAALALRPRSPGVYLNLARVLKRRGQRDEAIVALQKAIDLMPDYANAHYNLAIELQAEGKPDEAIAEYREAIRFGKDFFEAHCNLGAVLRDKGELDAAIAEFRESIRLATLLKKDHPFPHVGLGMALVDKGQLDEALAECQKALRLNKDMPEAHDTLGMVLRAKGELDEAIKECRNALLLKPDFAEAHISLGNALSDKGDEDAAIAEYREAIHMKNNDAEAHFNLAGSLRFKGQLDEAITEFEKAIRFKKNYADAHNNLGVVLKDKGRMDAAIAEYKKAIDAKPTFAAPHHNLGVAYMDLGRTDEAIAEYREAIRLKMNDGQPHHYLRKALYKKGEGRGPRRHTGRPPPQKEVRGRPQRCRRRETHSSAKSRMA
jgi:serine/threonine protein kinase/tetratricopeptide (TPR) repeat protein